MPKSLLTASTGKKLIIAEKPSVAQDIARSVGGFTREGDYFESDDYVLSSAVGHLLELAVPEEYEVKRGKWSFAHLPVIPPHFTLHPIDKTAERLRLLTRLIKRKDVDGLVNACDAGREGELIFNYIVEHSKSTKPIERLWLQSMTTSAIRDGFVKLRSAQEVEGLRQAAMSRAESDWLIGINGTRAMTAFNSKTGGFHLTTVGRVQTPTLAIVVRREEEIRRFRSRDYWEIEGHFGAVAGDYAGRWFDEKFRKPEGDEHARPSACGTKPRRARFRPSAPARPGRSRKRRSRPPSCHPALRSDVAAEGGQWPLRLFRPCHAADRAGAVRKAQGADLPADRCARAAGGLPADGHGRTGAACRTPMHRMPTRSSSMAG
jgi:DNA topoisomerase-3